MEAERGTTGTLGSVTKIEVSMRPPTVNLKINGELLAPILKSNLSCHANKQLNQELIETITTQIIECIDYFLSNKVD